MVVRSDAIGYELLRLIGLFLTAHVSRSFHFLFPFFRLLIISVQCLYSFIIFNRFVSVRYSSFSRNFSVLPATSVCSSRWRPSTDDANQPRR